jgi:hypothetical protein
MSSSVSKKIDFNQCPERFSSSNGASGRDSPRRGVADEDTVPELEVPELQQ